jgi:MFS family permease
MPVKLISHTLPVVGTLGAMAVGAAFTTLLELAETYLLEVRHETPLSVGALLVSQVLGVGLAAWLFKRVLPTRWMPYFALSGLLCVAAAAVLLLAVQATAIVPAAAVLLGFGAGAGVAPALFLAGLSVASSKIGPTFALVELLRSEAAFLLGPVLLAAAMTASSLTAGLHAAIAITLGFLLLGGVALVAIYRLGGATPHAPDLEGWLGGEDTAYE